MYAQAAPIITVTDRIFHTWQAQSSLMSLTAQVMTITLIPKGRSLVNEVPTQSHKHINQLLNTLILIYPSNVNLVLFSS